MNKKNRAEKKQVFWASPEEYCSGCGAEAGRLLARYCRVCGKKLGEGYQPLDTTRSAQRMQGKSFVFEREQNQEFSEVLESAELFAVNRNVISQIAWACFVYSLVPYVGILFIPLTFLLSGAALFAWFRKPWIGGRQRALAVLSLSFVVLAMQILLWWLLYIIPNLGRPF